MPSPTQEPVESGIAAFTQVCEQSAIDLASAFGGDEMGGDEDITWGDFAEVIDALVGAHDQLSPPQEIRAYHDAVLRVYESLRDHARSRPSEDSFLEEFLPVIFEIFGASLEIGFDTTKTDEEKEQEIEKITQELLGDLFGAGFGAVNQAAEEAREALSEEILALLDDAGCYSDIFALEEEDQEGVAPTATGDEHGDSIEDATPIRVGEALNGAVDYGGDVDFFRFTAEAGQLYQIDVSLGTLPDSDLELQRSDGWRLASNDDHGDSQASRIVWRAPDAGEYFLVVGGWSDAVGSYTLTVSPSTLVDDHGDDIDSATAASVGVAVEGVIDYEGDVDFFRFTAEAGQLYQIDVSLGTLPDSDLELQRSDGWRLASNDDHGDSQASRIFWEAPDAGEYFLVVGGWSDAVGSYTLTVSPSTLVDDHGDDIDSATAASVGVAVEGVIDYEGDVDFFRFTAEAGQLYQIDVSLGTLPDSDLELQRSDGWRLASNDDHGDSQASRIFWEAPDAGEYFLVVGGWSDAVGSYTLIIAAR